MRRDVDKCMWHLPREGGPKHDTHVHRWIESYKSERVESKDRTGLWSDLMQCDGWHWDRKSACRQRRWYSCRIVTELIAHWNSRLLSEKDLHAFCVVVRRVSCLVPDDFIALFIVVNWETTGLLSWDF